MRATPGQETLKPSSDCLKRTLCFTARSSCSSSYLRSARRGRKAHRRAQELSRHMLWSKGAAQMEGLDTPPARRSSRINPSYAAYLYASLRVGTANVAWMK